MAMGLYGLEETPYSGWTLTDMVACGHRLTLTCPKNDCSSLTGWTKRTYNGSIVDFGVEFGRFKGTVFQDMQSPLTHGANWDLRVDYDVILNTSGAALMLMGWLSDSSENITIRFHDTDLSMFSTGGVQEGSTATALDRLGTLRLARAGNVFTSYYWNRLIKDWSQIAQATLAYSTTGEAGGPFVLNCNDNGTTLRMYYDNIRNVVPSVTSGTAESPDIDTVDGYRGCGWFVVPGTGTVTVEVKTASSQAGLSGASYAAATAWQDVTPSSSNRWVKVKVTISGGSTSAASPEVGPVLINSTITQANAQLLFKRATAMMHRHTDSNYRLTINELASSGSPYTGLWNRTGYGIANYFAGGNSSSITFESTSYNLATDFVEGVTRTFTDISGDQQLLVEAAAYGLYGLIKGGSTLYNHANITAGEKQTWTTAINAQINESPALNWETFSMETKACLNALEAVDPGNWDTYNLDADYSGHWTDLESGHLGEGIWNDALGGTFRHVDMYSTAIIPWHLSLFREIYGSGFTSNSDVELRLKQALANLRRVIGPEGHAVSHGRSLHAATWVQPAGCAHAIADAIGGGYGMARELYSRGIWSMLRNGYFFGHDIVAKTLTREADPSSIESSTTTHALTNAMWAGCVGACGYDDSIDAATADGPADSVCWVWPAGGLAYHKASGATNPHRYVHIADHETSTDAAKYLPGLICGPFGPNTGEQSGGTNIPQFNTGSIAFRETAGSASNVCHLSNATTRKVLHCGRAVIAWRSGNATENSSTVDGGDSGVVTTEAHVLYGHHAVAAAKIEADTDTVVYVTPPIPTAASGSMANSASGDAGPVYGYGENADGTLSAYAKAVTSDFDDGRTNTAHLSGADQNNRRWVEGWSPDVRVSGALTGTKYHVVDMALKLGTMTAANEHNWLADYARTSDEITFTADDTVSPADCYVAMVSQNTTDEAIGTLWAVTGSALRGFVGDTSGTWGGGGDLTAIKYNSANVLALATAGNASFDKISSGESRVVYDGASQLTLYPPALPTGFDAVYARKWDGTWVDVTVDCTVTAATSIVVPTTAVDGADYDAGLVELKVTGAAAATGQTISRRPVRFFRQMR